MLMFDIEERFGSSSDAEILDGFVRSGEDSMFET